MTDHHDTIAHADTSITMCWQATREGKMFRAVYCTKAGSLGAPQLACPSAQKTPNTVPPAANEHCVAQNPPKELARL